MSSNNPHIEEHIGEWLSGYIDGELTQQQRQRVEVHCSGCASCAQKLEEFSSLRAEIGAARLGQYGENTWREHMNEPTGRAIRGLGWILLIGAILVVAGITVFTFLLEPSIAWTFKLLSVAGYGGLLLLFISVLRQRLAERKTDKYKDVEI